MGRKHRFTDRPPGTMAYQRRVGPQDRISQPRRLPVKVTHPDGQVEWVPAVEYDRRRKFAREVREVLRRFDELAVEIREERGLPPQVAEAFAWSHLEREVDARLWQAAREHYERGGRSETAIPIPAGTTVIEEEQMDEKTRAEAEARVEAEPEPPGPVEPEEEDQTIRGRWPMERDSEAFMRGFQRGYAEALTDLCAAGSDAATAAEALLALAAILEDPFKAAQDWVAEDDGSIK